MPNIRESIVVGHILITNMVVQNL